MKKLLKYGQEDMASEIAWMKYQEDKDNKAIRWYLWGVFIVSTVLLLVCMFSGCSMASEGNITHLKASWYSVSSLKKEGTYKYSKGVMANGHIFSDNNFTCATRLYPLGSMVRVTNSVSKSFVIVKVTDRIGKRFAKTRIDLSKGAFSRVANINDGLINVEVERIL